MSSVLNLEIVKPPPKWRTLLILGRVSNLPTVWSNCLAGWTLGHGGQWRGLAAAVVSVTFLYIGGMFLNDAFDADFDRRHRALRPIPGGLISEAEVWRWGTAWLALGVAGLLWTGTTAAALAGILAACIVVYDATHKHTTFGPALMGGCRFLVYLTAAAAGGGALTGEVIWPAVALGLYVLGVSGLARRESGKGRPAAWPIALLAAPLALAALLGNDDRWSRTAALVGSVGIWIVWAVAETFWRTYPRVGATVSRLLAGLALVDLLAVAPGESRGLWAYPALFLAAIFLQRFVPAT